MDNFITPSDSLGETNTRPVILSAKDEISKMCLSVLDDVEAGKIKNLPINERTLRRAVNGESIDEKTVRTVACLYYNTEEFDELIALVPVSLKHLIENANSKLSHQGNVPFEVARNPGLVKLWNLCLGYGCTKSLGEEYFGDEFITMVNALVEYKLVTKSVLMPDLWIANGEMIINRDDLLFHFDQMGELSSSWCHLTGPLKFNITQISCKSTQV